MKRILIADGSDTEATRLQQALELQGHRTARLADGGQFLGFCQEHQPDLVIVDVDLPVVNGWAAVHGLRTEESTAAIPAIGLSSHASDVEQQQARSIGFNGLYSKPVDMDGLVAGVEKVLEAGAVGVKPGNLPGADPQPAAESSAIAAVSPVTSAPLDGDDEDCSFERVDQVAKTIAELISKLRPSVSNLGADGPELFGYIENGERQITEQLDAIAEQGPDVTANALYDKELRHDFRNLIGSVTGFAELILMENGLEPAVASALTQIRQHSSEFVRLLDAQKAAAATA